MSVRQPPALLGSRLKHVLRAGIAHLGTPRPAPAPEPESEWSDDEPEPVAPPGLAAPVDAVWNHCTKKLADSNEDDYPRIECSKVPGGTAK